MNAFAASSPRRRIVLLLLGVLLLTVRPSWASCSPPEINVDERDVTAGDRIEVSGIGWSDGCPTPREGGCGHDEQPEPSALTDIEVRLVPRDASLSSILVGSVDAGEDYEFELTVLVPKSVPPGPYTVEARAAGTVNEPPVPIVVNR